MSGHIGSSQLIRVHVISYLEVILWSLASYPNRIFNSTSQSLLARTSPETKIHPYRISNRRLWMPTPYILIHVIKLPSEGSDHTEHDVPANLESDMYFILSS